MSGKLKIYACSGIGDVQEKAVAYWTDNTRTIDNTQAVNTLLALINRNYIEVARLRGMSPVDKIANLNDIDLYVLCLHAAQYCNSHYVKLQRAGAVIGSMLASGAFNFDSLNTSDRDAHLDQLLEQFNELYQDESAAIQHNKDFEAWFDKTVVKRNKVGLSTEQRKKIESVMAKKIKGIGKADADWMENADLAEYLTKGSEYFLYTYFTSAQLNKLPAVFENKKQKQLRTYNYCKSLFVDVYGSEEEMQEIIRAGIIDYFESTPEEVCASIVKGGKVKGVGVEPVTTATLGAAEIVSIIASVLTFIGGVIAAICSMVAQRDVAKYGALDEKIISTSTPNPEDFDGLDVNGQWKAKTNWPILAAAGIAALLLLRK